MKQLELWVLGAVLVFVLGFGVSIMRDLNDGRIETALGVSK